MRTLLRVTAMTSLLLVLYVLLPLDRSGTGASLAYLVVGGAVFLATLVWQVQRIMTDDYPQLRALESVGVAIPLLIVVFASTYVAMSAHLPASFSQPLTRIRGLYFTIATLSTVGYGDIVPRSDIARLVVMVQMLLDLALVAVLVRLLAHAARRGLERQRSG